MMIAANRIVRLANNGRRDMIFSSALCESL
jgi:hypothetical protein